MKKDIPRCSALRRWVVAGVEGRLATRISHRPRNFLNECGSVVEYQSEGREPSISPVPGTMYCHQSMLGLLSLLSSHVSHSSPAP